jgi:hypothetical protein
MQVVAAGVHVLQPGQKVTVYKKNGCSPRQCCATCYKKCSRRGCAGHAAALARRPSEAHMTQATTQSGLQPLQMGAGPSGADALPDGGADAAGLCGLFPARQDEDPPFTFRAMVVRTYWPGATAQQVAEQVTDKIERTLQEVPYADKIRSYSKPGESQIIFQIKDSSRAARGAQRLVQVRKKVGDMRFTLPAGRAGAVLQRRFGDVYGVIYALEADGFSYAELKTFADDVRQQLLRVPDVAKVELFGVQDEKLYIEISQKRLAQLGLDMNQVLAQLGQQNAVEAAGAVQTPLDVVQVRVGGQFNAIEDCAPCRSGAARATSCAWATLPTIKRGYVDPPTVKVRHQGKEVIALGVSMAKGGDIIALGKALTGGAASIGRPAAGVKLVQVQDQPKAWPLGQRIRQGADRGGGDRAGRELHRLGFHKRPRPACRCGGATTSTCAPGWWWASPFRWCWR